MDTEPTQDAPEEPDEGGDPFGQIQHPKKRAFLWALVEAGGNIRRACELAEIDRSTPYTAQWLEDEEFQKSLVLAKSMGADHLEAEAIRRAYEGVEEPVGFYKGSPSAYVRRYSDTLTIFLLKGLKPDRYVERRELTGPGGSPLLQGLTIEIVEPREDGDGDAGEA